MIQSITKIAAHDRDLMIMTTVETQHGTSIVSTLPGVFSTNDLAKLEREHKQVLNARAENGQLDGNQYVY